MSWWRVIDTTEWGAAASELRGIRPKEWILDPGSADEVPWLRKSPRGVRYTEPAVESFTLALAARCGFEVAEGHAAVWRVGDQRGFVSRKFHDPTAERLVDGGDLLGVQSDSAASRIGLTLDVIREQLLRVEDRYRVPLCAPFLRTVAFDAWIGNGDRHTGNWALLIDETSSTCRFAPMYDTAACLGTELLDNHKCLRPTADGNQIQSYANKCKSGYGDGVAEPGILQRDVLVAVRAWPEWSTAYATVLAACKHALVNHVDGMLDEVPDDWWPAPRRHFARRLLALRAKLLEQAAP